MSAATLAKLRRIGEEAVSVLSPSGLDWDFDVKSNAHHEGEGVRVRARDFPFYIVINPHGPRRGKTRVTLYDRGQRKVASWCEDRWEVAFMSAISEMKKKSKDRLKASDPSDQLQYLQKQWPALNWQRAYEKEPSRKHLNFVASELPLSLHMVLDTEDGEPIWEINVATDAFSSLSNYISTHVLAHTKTQDWRDGLSETLREVVKRLEGVASSAMDLLEALLKSDD